MDYFLNIIKSFGEYDTLALEMLKTSLKILINKRGMLLIDNNAKVSKVEEDTIISIPLKQSDVNETSMFLSLFLEKDKLELEIAPLVTDDNYHSYPRYKIILLPKNMGSIISITKGYYNSGLGFRASFITGPDEETGVIECSVKKDDSMDLYSLESWCEKTSTSAKLTSPSIEDGITKLDDIYEKGINSITKLNNGYKK